MYALSALILSNGALFFCDTHVTVDPTAEEVAEMTLLAADAVRGFGIVPRRRCCRIPASAAATRSVRARCAGR